MPGADIHVIGERARTNGCDDVNAAMLIAPGSVSRHCTAHAHGRVVVVRGYAHEAEER